MHSDDAVYVIHSALLSLRTLFLFSPLLQFDDIVFVIPRCYGSVLRIFLFLPPLHFEDAVYVVIPNPFVA